MKNYKAKAPEPTLLIEQEKKKKKKLHIYPLL